MHAILVLGAFTMRCFTHYLAGHDSLSLMLKINIRNLKEVDTKEDLGWSWIGCGPSEVESSISDIEKKICAMCSNMTPFVSHNIFYMSMRNDSMINKSSKQNSRLSSQFVNFATKLMWLVFTGILLQGRWGLSIPISIIWGTLPKGNSRLFPSRNHTCVCREAKNTNKHLTAISCPLIQAPCKHVVRYLTIFAHFFHENLIFNYLHKLYFLARQIEINIMIAIKWLKSLFKTASWCF